MVATEFFEAVLPEKGTIFVVRFTKKRHRHYAATKDTFLETLSHEIAPERASKTDALYFTPNSFKTAKLSDPSGRYKPGRRADNGAYSRSLFVDIDCGPEKRYKTKAEGLAALQHFCTASKLPLPTAFVDSGRGIHCYWVFSEDLEQTRWLPAAKALKQLTRQHRFDVDPTCTADFARILRVPGSLNRKVDPAVECRVVSFSPERVYAFDDFVGKFDIPHHAFGDAADNADLELPQEYALPSYMAKIVEQCPLMHQIAQDRGRWCSEPLWKATLQVAWFAKDGQEWAHALSDGHPQYDFEATQKKFEERVNSLGPATCEQLQDAALVDGVDVCQSCTHRGQFKSPIRLGVEDRAPIVDDAGHVYPRGWAFKDDGVYKLVEGEEQRVIGLKIDNFAANETELDTGGWGVVFSFDFWCGKQYTATVEQKALVDKRTLYQALVSQRVTLSSESELKWFALLMNSWVDTLRRAGKITADAPKRHFGWVNGAKDEFVIGKQLITPDGVYPVNSSDSGKLYELYTPCGGKEVWQSAAEAFYGIPELETVIATAFASPLLHYTHIAGAIVSIVSQESGVGKSSALKVAQAVWGHPVRGINALDDTEKSIFTKLGVLRNLPAYWDELRGRDTVRRFSKLAFRLSQGKDMSRLSRSAALRDVRDWQVLLTCAANTPLLGLLEAADHESSAGAMRLLEYYADGVQLDTSKFNEVSSKLNALGTNYGAVGMLYAAWLVKNPDKTKTLLDKTIETVITQMQCTQDERFWVVTVASLLVGATIANSIGLTRFDLAALKRFLYNAISGMRNSVHSLSSSMTFYDILGAFVREHSPTELVTDIMQKTPGRTMIKAIVHSIPRQEVVITHRIARKDRRIRIPTKVFNDWARRNDYNPRHLIMLARRENAYIGKYRMNLTAGTVRKGTREWVFDFHLHPLHALSVEEGDPEDLEEAL